MEAHDAQIKLEEERRLFDLKSKKVLQILRTKDETIAELEEKIKFLSSSSSSYIHEDNMKNVLRNLPSYPVRDPIQKQLINHNQIPKHEIDTSYSEGFGQMKYQLKEMERERQAATNSLNNVRRESKENIKNDDVEVRPLNGYNRISPGLKETSLYNERDNSTSTLFQRKISFDDSQHDKKDRNIVSSQFSTPQNDNENDFTQNNSYSSSDSSKKLNHRIDKVDDPAIVKVDNTNAQAVIVLFKERVERSEERNTVLERRIHELTANEKQMKERIDSLQAVIQEQQVAMKANQLEEKILQLSHNNLQPQEHPTSPQPNPNLSLYNNESPNQNFDVNMWWVYVWRHCHSLQMRQKEEHSHSHPLSSDHNTLQDQLQSQAIEITTAKQNMLVLTLRQRRSMEEMQLELWKTHDDNMALRSRVEALRTENTGLKDILRKCYSDLSSSKHSSGADAVAIKIELQTERTSVAFLRAELDSSRDKIDQLNEKCLAISEELKAVQSALDVREVMSSITDIPGLHAAQLIESFSGEIVRLKSQLANSSVKNTSAATTTSNTSNGKKDRLMEKLGLSPSKGNSTEESMLASALHSIDSVAATPTTQLVDCLDVIVLTQRVSALQDTIQQLKSYIIDLEKKCSEKTDRRNIHSPVPNSSSSSTGNTDGKDDGDHEIEEIVYSYNDIATLNVKLETGIRREVMLKEQLSSYKSEMQSMHQQIRQLQEEIHKDRISSLASTSTPTPSPTPTPHLSRDGSGRNCTACTNRHYDHNHSRNSPSPRYLPLPPPPPSTSPPSPAADQDYQEDKKSLQRQLCEKSAQIKVLEESLESIMSTPSLINDPNPVPDSPAPAVLSPSLGLMRRTIELSSEVNSVSTANLRLQYSLEDMRNELRHLRNEHTLKMLTIDSQNQAIIHNNALVTSLRTQLQESERRFREDMAVLERDRDESKDALLESEIEVKHLQSKVCELNALNQLSENKDYEKWRSRKLREESLHLALKAVPPVLHPLSQEHIYEDADRGSGGEGTEDALSSSKSLSVNISELLTTVKKLLTNLSQNTNWKSNEYLPHHHHQQPSHSSELQEDIRQHSSTMNPPQLPLTLGAPPYHLTTTTTTTALLESREAWKPFINKVVTVITGLNGRIRDAERNHQISMQENFLLSQKYGNIKSQLKFCAMELVRCRRLLYVHEKLTVPPKSETISNENRISTKLRKELTTTKESLWRSKEKELRMMSELREVHLKLDTSESQIKTLKFDWLQLQSRPASASVTSSVSVEAKQFALQTIDQRLTEMDRNMKHWCQEAIPKLVAGYPLGDLTEEIMDFGVRMNPSDMGGERRPALTMALAESCQQSAQLQRQLLVANEQRDVFEKHCLKMEQAILLWNQSPYVANTTTTIHSTTTTGDYSGTHPSQQQQQQGTSYPNNNNNQRLFESLQEKSSDYLQQLRVKTDRVLELEESVMKLSSDLSSKEFVLTELRQQYDKMSRENQRMCSGSLKEMKKWKRDIEKSHAKELQTFKDSVLRERNSLLEECHRVSLEEEVFPPVNEYYSIDKDYYMGKEGRQHSNSQNRKEPCGHCNCCLALGKDSHRSQGNVSGRRRGGGVADNAIDSPVSVRSDVSSSSSSSETGNEDEVYGDSPSSNDKNQRYSSTRGKKVAEEVDVFPSEVSRQHKKSRVDHEIITSNNNGNSPVCSLSSSHLLPGDGDVSQYESALSDRGRRFDGEDMPEYGSREFGAGGLGDGSMAHSNQESSECLLQAPPMEPPPPSYANSETVESNNQLLLLHSQIARLESQVQSLEREIGAERRKNEEASEQISQLQQMVDVQLNLSSQQRQLQPAKLAATTSRHTLDVGCQADWESSQQQQYKQQYYSDSANISVEQELSQSQCSYPVTEDTLLGQSSVMESVSASVQEAALAGGDAPPEMKSHIVELDHLVSALYLSLRAMSYVLFPPDKDKSKSEKFPTASLDAFKSQWKLFSVQVSRAKQLIRQCRSTYFRRQGGPDTGGRPMLPTATRKTPNDDNNITESSVHHQYGNEGSTGSGSGSGSLASEKQDIQGLQREHQFQLQQLQTEHEQYIQKLTGSHQNELEDRDSFISRLKESIQDSKAELRNHRKQNKELEAQIRHLTLKMDRDQHRDKQDKGTMTYFITEEFSDLSRHRNIKPTKMDQYSAYSAGNGTAGGDATARKSRSHSWSGRQYTPPATPAPRTGSVASRYAKRSAARDDSREERLRRARSADGRVERSRGRSRDSRGREGSYGHSFGHATNSEKAKFSSSSYSNDRIAHVEKQMSKLFRTVAGERNLNQSIGDIIDDAAEEEERISQSPFETGEKEEREGNPARTDTGKFSGRKGESHSIPPATTSSHATSIGDNHRRQVAGNIQQDNESLLDIMEQLKKQLEALKAENARKAKLMKEFRSLRLSDQEALKHEKDTNKSNSEKLTRLQSVLAGRESALRTLKEKYESLERECAARDRSSHGDAVAKLKDCEAKLLQSRQRISTLKSQLKVLQTESENQRTVIEGFRQKEKVWETQAADRERKENLLKGLRESREKERQERQEEVEEAAMKIKKLKHRYSALERKYSILNSEKEKLFETLTSKLAEVNNSKRTVDTSPPMPSKVISARQTFKNQEELCLPLGVRDSPLLHPHITETEDEVDSEEEEVVGGGGARLLNVHRERRSKLRYVAEVDPSADTGENFEDEEDDDISIDARLLEHISKDVKPSTNRKATSPPHQPTYNEHRQSLSTSVSLPTALENKRYSSTFSNENSEQENRKAEANFSWAEGLFEDRTSKNHSDCYNNNYNNNLSSNIVNDIDLKYSQASNTNSATGIAAGNKTFTTSADFDRRNNVGNKFGNQLWASHPAESIPSTTTTAQELQDIITAIGGRTYSTLLDNSTEDNFTDSNSRFRNSYSRPDRPTISDNNIPRQPLFIKSKDTNTANSHSTGRQVSYKTEREKSDINLSTSYSFSHTNQVSKFPSDRSVTAITSSSLNTLPSPRDSECSSVTSGDDCSAEGRLKALISAALADTPKHH